MSSATPSWPAQRVIMAAQKGDEHAIALLVSGSRPHVQRFARTLCSSPEDAEDAAQEALVVLYRKIGTLRVAAALSSWMFQIVLRECRRRTHFIVMSHPRAPPASEISAESAALAKLEVRRIIQAIATLPPDQRSVIVLRDIQGLSGSATANTLGLSRAAMKSRLHRGRETLRAELSPAGARTRSS